MTSENQRASGTPRPRVYASDLPVDGRWPYFLTARQLEALVAFLREDAPRDPDTGLLRQGDLVARAALIGEALVKPPAGRTGGAKRLYWTQPEGTIMIRLTNAERHALLAALGGVATYEIIHSYEVQGVLKHLRSRAKAFRKRLSA